MNFDARGRTPGAGPLDPDRQPPTFLVKDHKPTSASVSRNVDCYPPAPRRGENDARPSAVLAPTRHDPGTLAGLDLAGADPARLNQAAPSLSVESVVRDLATIWAIDFAPDGRIFLTERSGRIRTVRDGALDPEPWMSIDGVVESGESGLMGLALDPEFAANGYVYATYTYAAEGGGLQNRLVRLKEDRATGRGTMDTILLDDVRGGRVHDGGRVKIGPDGKLYWTMGESGSQDLAQSLDTLNGKILRLNLDGSIPADNPFPGSPIYSYGHRNPQGLAWQPGTGLLFALEHGPSGQQSCCDEVNLIMPGHELRLAPGVRRPAAPRGRSRRSCTAAPVATRPGRPAARRS